MNYLYTFVCLAALASCSKPAERSDDAGSDSDSGFDGGADAGVVASFDAGGDAGLDAGTDAGFDPNVACAVRNAATDPQLVAALRAIHVRVAGTPRVLSIENAISIAQTPAVTLAVRRADGPVFVATYGDTRSAAPLTSETLFQAGSISKAVWSMALLSRSDTVQWLDADVRAQLPALVANHTITPAMLLSHSAGAGVHGYLGYAPSEALPTLEQIVRGQAPANSATVRFGPGGQFNYSGGGFETLEWWFQVKEAMHLPDFVRDSLFVPAGLKRSTYQQPLPSSEVNHACGQETPYLSSTVCNYIYPEHAAAGLWTTPAELVCLAAYLSEARPDVLARARSQSLEVAGYPQRIGLGIFHRTEGAVHLFEHGGANVGFCGAWVFFDDGRAIAVLENSCSGLAQPVARSLCLGLGWPCSGDDFAAP